MKTCLLLLLPVSVFARTFNIQHPLTINFKKQADYERQHPVKYAASPVQDKVSGKVKPDMHLVDSIVGALPIAIGTGMRHTKQTPLNTLAPAQLQPLLVTTGVSDRDATIPPDGQTAVGPAYILNTTNQDFLIKNKQGDSVTSLSFQSFFNAGVGTAGAFDPRCAFYKGHFIVSADSETIGIVIAVSQTADPTGNWWLYHFASAAGGTFTDYPMLGFNRQWLVVTANFTSTYGYTEIFTACMDSVLSGNLNQINILWDSTICGLYPCKQAGTDKQSDTLWLITNYLGAYRGQGIIEVSCITGTGNMPVYNSGHKDYLFTPFSWNDQDLGCVPQFNASCIVVDDSRFPEAYFYKGDIYTVHSVFQPDTNPSYSAVDFLQIHPDINGNIYLVSSQRFSDPNGIISYCYPGLAINDSGDIGIVMNLTGSTIYMSAAYSIKLRNSAAFTTPYIYQAGTSWYDKNFNHAFVTNRWGDYNSAAVDPVDGSFWFTAEWPSHDAYWQPGFYGSWNEGIAHVGLIDTLPCAAPFITFYITDTSAIISAAPNAAYMASTYLYKVAAGNNWQFTQTGKLSALLPCTNYDVMPFVLCYINGQGQFLLFPQQSFTTICN